MKAVNIPVRLKSPWFWVGVVSIIITAIGLDPTTMTSWGAVLDAVEAVFRNPVQLVTAVLAVLAVFVDPTTAGLTDSARALSYTAPNKDK